MKTAHDPRHLKRRQAVQELFAETFTHQHNTGDLTQEIVKQIATIDEKISASAPAWPLDINS